MTTVYRIAADCIVVAHMGYVLTVVLGLPAIWWGIVRKHRWARNVWWRCGHLAMILVVVAESWAGITCPLTVWEQQLREAAGGQSYRILRRQSGSQRALLRSGTMGLHHALHSFWIARAGLIHRRTSILETIVSMVGTEPKRIWIIIAV